MSTNLLINNIYFSVLIPDVLIPGGEKKLGNIKYRWKTSKERLQSMHEDIQLITVNDTVDPKAYALPKLRILSLLPTVCP